MAIALRNGRTTPFRHVRTPMPSRRWRIGSHPKASSNGQRSEQRTDIRCFLQQPERLKNRIGFLAWPTFADIPSEFAVDVRPLHRLTRETGNVVDLAADALPIRTNRGDAS